MAAPTADSAVVTAVALLFSVDCRLITALEISALVPLAMAVCRS